MTNDKLNIAIEKIKEDPFKFASYLGITEQKGTEGSIRDEMSFMASPDGTGVVGTVNDIQYLNSKGKQVYLSWEDLAEISDVAVSEKAKEKDEIRRRNKISPSLINLSKGIRGY